MLKQVIILMIALMILPLINSIENPITVSQPVYPNGEVVELNFPCSFNGGICPITTVCNVTIITPSSYVLINNQLTIRNDSVFVYVLNENQTIENGQHEVSLTCCSGSTCRNRLLTFLITPSGASPISSGQGAIMFGVMGVIFFVTIIFFIIAFKYEHVVLKTGGFAFGSIGVFVLILYSLLLLNETISTSPSLISGFETFYTAIKMIGTVLILVMVIVLFLVFAKAWKIRRGLIDK